MTTLELEADKARLAYAILSIDNASLLAEVKKKLGDLLTINGPAVKKQTQTYTPYFQRSAGYGDRRAFRRYGYRERV